MAVLTITEAPGATTQQYDRTNEILGIDGEGGAPDGLIQHLAASDGSGLLIVDVWESEEAFRRFGERLGAALEESGIGRLTQQPRMHEGHNRLTGVGSDASYVILIDVDDLGSDAYDQMVGKMDAHTADGSQHPCVTHTAARTDGGMVIADVWDSPEAFGKFGEEQIGPAGAAVGMGPIEPRIVPVHASLIRDRAAQPAS